jgi:hypothetical protein
VALALPLLASLSAACGGFAGSEELTFDDRAEAVGRMEASVTRLLPDSARAIRQRRDLSSGRLWARFDFAAADRQSVASACEAEASSLGLLAAQARGIAWWPEMLVADTAAAEEQFEFFRCDGPGGQTGWLARHRTVDTAVYWEAGQAAAR